MQVSLRIVGRNLPGLQFCERDRVHLGIQRAKEVVDVVPGDAPQAVFDFTVNVVPIDTGLDFRGPFVHGKRNERFLYLSWGQVHADGRFEMFRRAKLHLSVIDQQDVARAIDTGATITGTLSLTDRCGGPLCSSIRPPTIEWRVVQAATS